MRTEEQQREYDADMEQAAMSQGEYLEAAVRQHTSVYGEERQDQEYLLSPFDTWEKNPWYQGEPGPHPEDQDACEHHSRLANEVGYHAYFLFCEQQLVDAGVVERDVDTFEDFTDEDLPF